ncbi:unnamed protein product [Mytilus coruscus]|uniref:CCHC-type domain-containing protein n=1 Tax=Mytilus coruscus TaxID=42192 RepID=A0A6J8BPC9_MYTCO|nr:unnamed protein product [Mytilus coruscus]
MTAEGSTSDIYTTEQQEIERKRYDGKTITLATRIWNIFRELYFTICWNFNTPENIKIPTYGRIEEFKFENNFEEYTERLEEYFLANEIDDDDKKRSIFLTVCGEKTYSLLRNVCAPAKPNTKTFDNLKEVLTDHLRPKPLIIAERFKFHQRKQESHEKVRDYLANLRKLTDTCQFNVFLEEALRDRLVCGLYSKTIQRKLLSESELDLKKAFEIAVGIEAAEKETNEFRNEVSTTHKVTMRSSECYRCGKSGHNADSCFYKNSRCHKCKEIGHISRKCRKSFPKNENQDKVKKQYKKNTKFKAKPSKVHQIEENSESEPEENSGWEVFTVKTCRTSDNKELKLDVKIGDIDYVMELDTGAAVSIIGEENYKKYFSNIKLQKSNVKLNTYTGDPITVIGEMTVNVVYDKQTELLPLIVVKEGPYLFGRNWLSKLTVDWKHIRSVITPSSVKDKVNKLMQMDVFKDELGTVKGMQASLKLTEEAVPTFFKPRPIPYALRDKVADEIKRLEKQGILEKIKFSEWGAPINPVVKPDGSVRICGDYKVTINSCLEVPQYPLPKAEDLFSRLNGGKKFSKLDLSQAYQQLLLFLEGLDGVGCILDDLIITGKSDEEHLKNLELVLKRLSEYGLRLKKSKCSLMKSEVEYFAFIVSKDGIQPSPKKVEAMLKVPEPENVKELQSWLGRPTKVYLNSQMYCWVISVFSVVGMVFNSIFLWISTENSERRNLTDSTMISASITMIIKGFSLFVNGFLANIEGSKAIYGQLQIGLDVMVIHSNSDVQILEFNLVCQLVGMILTPCALGILIEPRRGFLMSFWCMDTLPSEQNKKSPAKNPHELDVIDNELVITSKLKRSDRHSETSCATNCTDLSSRCCSLLDSPGTKIEGNHALGESEGDITRYDIEKLISRKRSICKEGSIEIRI